MKRLPKFAYILLAVISLPIMGYVLYFLAAFYFLGAAVCGTTPYQTVDTPDNHYSARIEQRDCGATTAYGTAIVLESKQWYLPGSQTILTVEGHPLKQNIDIHWTNSKTLTIKIPKHTTVYQKKKKWRDITVHYTP